MPGDTCLTFLELSGTKTKIVATKAELKELQSTLHTLKAAPTTASLRETVAVLEAEIRGLEAALVPIRANPARPISAAEKAAVDIEYEKLERLLRGRRKQFKEFWGTICDGCGDMNPSDLWVSHIVILLVNTGHSHGCLFRPDFAFKSNTHRTAPSTSTIAFFFLFPSPFRKILKAYGGRGAVVYAEKKIVSFVGNAGKGADVFFFFFTELHRPKS